VVNSESLPRMADRKAASPERASSASCMAVRFAKPRPSVELIRSCFIRQGLRLHKVGNQTHLRIIQIRNKRSIFPWPFADRPTWLGRSSRIRYNGPGQGTARRRRS